MSDSIITVENLSKKYLISHKKQEHYTAMRDVLVNGAKSFGKKLLGKGKNNNTKEEFWALKDINFEIKQGDRVGIIGRNGAGKSTLLKILSRITEPTTGKIHLRGRVASLLEVGTGFHPELTGRENIFLNGAIMGMSKWEIKKKFDEIVEFAEVEKFLDTPVKRYSSGMYVRLAFAVAAHLEPEILIVDEVLAVGDAQFQKKCLGKMEDVGKEGRTVLFVSHNMNVINQLCNKSILLSKGQTFLIGKTEDAINIYSNIENKDNGKDLLGGNEDLEVLSLSCDAENLYIEDEVTFKIRILIKQEQKKYHFSIHLLDKNQNLLLASANLPSASIQPDPMFGVFFNKGTYSITCKLPKSLLNTGTYSLNFLILEDMYTIVLELKNVFEFTMMERGEMRKEFSGEWIGAIRPKLFWETKEDK